MRHPANHIFDLTPDTLEAWCESRSMPKFRARQILEWVYQKGVADPEKMSNLSKLDRSKLAAEITFFSGDIVRHQTATDGVQKLLIEWTEPTEPSGDKATSPSAEARRVTPLPVLPVPTEDSGPGTEDLSGSPSPTPSLRPSVTPSLLPQTECVMIPSDDRRTACISSQVGCPVGCRFCASGIGGLEGNLSAGRIVEQVWRLSRLEGVDRITNIVFMGMGEPLANFANVTRAIRIINSEWAFNISARKITISTVGLPQAIERLASDFDLPVTLALSLHAPNDEIRRQLIPWAEYCTIADLLAACRRWFDKTGREITLEYTLLRGVNDLPEHAIELAKLSKQLRANINLIRYNEVDGMPFKRPKQEDVLVFQELLRRQNVNAHIRASRGRDIAAACGQLRHESGPKAKVIS